MVEASKSPKVVRGRRVLTLLVLGAALIACSEEPPPKSDGQPEHASEGPGSAVINQGSIEPGLFPDTSIVPFRIAVPDLPPPPEAVLKAQLEVKLPEGYFRTPKGRIFAEKDGAEMVLVTEGEFLMGDTEGGDYYRAHRVFVSSFLIDRCEVTIEQFNRFARATGKEPVDHPEGVSPTLPKAALTWDEAVSYAQWAGRRLPTEAEWEKAARGDDGRRFPWGNEDDPLRRNGTRGEDTGGNPAPVGSFPTGVSPFGAFDMAGNLEEWCVDGYGKYPALEPGVVPRDPVAPLSGQGRAVRGGAYWSPSEDLKVFSRIGIESAQRPSTAGVRCVMGLP